MKVPLQSLLRARFSPPDWDLFEEITLQGRRMDACALARDRSYALWGFEVKHTRSDWLREVREPLKSLPLQQAVDSWYVVAPREVVKAGELPAGWGLLVPSGETLRVLVRAAVAPTRAVVSREMLHRIVWRLSERATRAERAEANFEEDIKRLVAELASGSAGKDALERADAAVKRAERAERELSELTERVRVFSMKSGIPLHNDWISGSELGAAVSAVRCVGMRSRTTMALEACVRTALTLKGDAEAALAAIAALEPKEGPCVDPPTTIS